MAIQELECDSTKKHNQLGMDRLIDFALDIGTLPEQLCRSSCGFFVGKSLFWDNESNTIWLKDVVWYYNTLEREKDTFKRLTDFSV